MHSNTSESRNFF